MQSLMEKQILHSAAIQHFRKLNVRLGRGCAEHLKSVYLNTQACTFARFGNGEGGLLKTEMRLPEWQ